MVELVGDAGSKTTAEEMLRKALEKVRPPGGYATIAFPGSAAFATPPELFGELLAAADAIAEIVADAGGVRVKMALELALKVPPDGPLLRLLHSKILDDAVRATPPGGVAVLVSEDFIDAYRDRRGATELSGYRRMLVEAPPEPFWAWLRTIPQTTTETGSPITALAVSQDSRLVVTGHHDGTVCRWDPGTGVRIGEPFTGHGDAVRAVAIAADVRQIVSGDEGGIIRRWSTTFGESIDIHTSSRGNGVSALVTTVGSRYLVAGFVSGDLRAWRLGSGRRDQSGFTIQTGAVTGLVAMPDGRVVMSSDENGVVHSWDATTGEFIERREVSDAPITALAVSPNGEHLVAGCADGRLRIWHQREKTFTTIEWGVSRVAAVAVTPDNRHVIAAHGTATVGRWALATGEPAGQLHSPTGAIDLAVVTPDGRHVLAGGRDGVLQRWDSTTGMPITDAALTERLADVVSDRESVDDALGITEDVHTIAAVLASLTTTPPLSVALLGDWGAGKSSFMRQLQVRMAALAEYSARMGPRAAFAANVRQVSFNAWHYSDDHLWVGLVEHLFRELAEPGPVAAETEQIDELESKLADDEEERTRLTHDLRAVEGIEARRGWLASVFAPLRSALVFRAALHGVRREVRAGGRQLWVAVALGVTGIGVAVAGAQLGQWLIAGLGGAILVPGAALSLMRSFGRYTETARERLLNRQTELADDIRATTKKLDELDPARRLKGLLDEIGAANRYADFRGLTGRVHQDLRRLSKDLAAARERWDGSGTPPLQRIVLYVDDLDRCTPGRVVEVLQAVNLLLTMDLFMVVIAVDPRWLTRSLRSRHVELFAERDVGPVTYLDKIFHIPFALRPMGDHAAGYLLSLLPPDHEPEPPPADQGADAPSPAALQPATAPTPRRPAPADAPEAVPAEPGTEPAPDGVNAEGLRVSKEEREFLARLTPLLSTPRAIKKLANLYRLLRLSVPRPNLDAFLAEEDGGPYQAAALLLAALAGSPQEARALLTSLTAEHPKDAEKDTVQGIVDTLRATRNDLAARLAELILAIRKDIPVHDDTATYRRWATVVARYGFETHGLFTGADRPMGW